MSFTPRSSIGVQPLPRMQRRLVFLTLLLFFVVAVPMFVFYATGYRYNFMDPSATITATGGMYITVAAKDGVVHLNEEPVNDLRVFRKAFYIQNLTPGMQHVHVQAPGLHTWVKELPVYPYIVTEASVFQLPVQPQVRPITEYQTSTGTQVYLQTSSSTQLFGGVSTTVPFMATTSKPTTTLERNSEYAFIKSLFATTTVASSSLLNRVVDEVSGALNILPTKSATTTEATTTIEVDTLSLREVGNGDVAVVYRGLENKIPYYFCVPQASLASTTALYGENVTRGVALALAAIDQKSETQNLNKICRSSIVIDRQYQKVLSFDFFPGSTDIVVLHRADGVYVTEVDDRSWQNTQALYPYPVDEMVVNSGKIYVKQGNRIFELVTELPVVL
jgi:hypothetical protein